jgi:arsenite methyltransferase
MKEQPHFFDFAAQVGLTKHIGGLAATDKLVQLCHISPNSTILDVGCGVGQTPCYLAKQVGCRVVGVDILPMMVQRAQERAQREDVEQRVEFRVADAQELPFETGRFDAVITESVTVFPEDKQRAVNEYVRVTRPGGYVGLNETTWLKVPPPPEIVAWAEQDIGASIKPQTAQNWIGLLETAGLTEIVSHLDPIDAKDETKGILQRYGWRGMLGILSRTLALYTKSPDYRQFVKRVQQDSGIIPENLTEYLAYGLFVGRK